MPMYSVSVTHLFFSAHFYLHLVKLIIVDDVHFNPNTNRILIAFKCEKSPENFITLKSKTEFYDYARGKTPFELMILLILNEMFAR